MQRGKLRTGAVLTIAVLWLIFAALYVFDTFERMENVLYDKIYQRRSEVDSRIVVVGIDDASLFRIGRWPWPRGVIADVVDKLTDGGAAAVGIDILFDTPTDGDERLAEAIKRSGVSALAVASPSSTAIRSKRTADGVFQAADLIMPAGRLFSSAARLAHVNGIPDSDGIMRKAQLYYYYNDRQYNSLAYEMYDIFSKGADIKTVPAAAGQYYIKFTGTAGYYHHISLADVYEGKIPPLYFKDKLVLIGMYAVEGVATDMQYTSIDSHHQMYGVEIHANLLQQFMEGKYIRDTPVWLDILIYVFLSLAAAVLLIKLKPKLGLILLLALLAVYAGIIYRVIISDYVTRIIYTPAFCISAYFFSLVWHYIQTRMNEIRVRNTFGRYMAPTVIKKILDEGEDGLKLGGQRLNVTVLFADIRGFTPMSEAVEPEEVVKILNEYLNLAASCIHRHGGTLDKFIGDAVMAIWGAPYEMQGHTHTMAAVNAAKDMRAESVELERLILEKYGRSVRFGIGINSGDAIIGNIGASFRMDYTAIGDTVNTAARLESNAKPGQILLSRAAADNLTGEDVALNSLGGLKFKGKAEEVQIYEVL